MGSQIYLIHNKTMPAATTDAFTAPKVKTSPFFITDTTFSFWGNNAWFIIISQLQTKINVNKRLTYD
jgi:hypothetical protein